MALLMWFMSPYIHIYSINLQWDWEKKRVFTVEVVYLFITIVCLSFCTLKLPWMDLYKWGFLLFPPPFLLTQTGFLILLNSPATGSVRRRGTWRLWPSLTYFPSSQAQTCLTWVTHKKGQSRFTGPVSFSRHSLKNERSQTTFEVQHRSQSVPV